LQVLENQKEAGIMAENQPKDEREGTEGSEAAETSPTKSGILEELTPEDDVDAAVAGGGLIPLNAIAEISIETAVQEAIKRQALTMRLLAFGISRTTSRDWADIEGQPHPKTQAVSQMLSQIGALVTEPRIETDRSRPDGHYMKRATGSIQRPGYAPIGVVGKAFSGNPFFTTRKRDGVKILLPPSEVDEAAVEGKAVTNYYYRALEAARGIKGLTWRDLAVFGIYPGETRIRFSKEDAAQTGSTNGGAKSSGGMDGNTASAPGAPFGFCSCGQPWRKRAGKDGKPDWLGCSGYPNCTQTRQMPREMPKESGEANGEKRRPTALEEKGIIWGECCKLGKSKFGWTEAKTFLDFRVKVGRELTQWHQADVVELSDYLEYLKQVEGKK
jgi:hypothetical protein